MSDVIKFPGGNGGEKDFVITTEPMRLRWGPWRTTKVLQVHVGAAAIYEDFRQDCLASGRDPAGQVPSAHQLDGGARETAYALLRFRHSAEKQARACYLATLMEALLGSSCAILRTDLIRRVYHEVEDISEELNLRWSSRSGSLLPPVDHDLYAPEALEHLLSDIDNLSHFFKTVRAFADHRYTTLAKRYVFYYPRAAGLR